jgi:predicted ATPase
MSVNHEAPAAIVAVFVGPAGENVRLGSTSLHEQQVARVRDLLASADGRVIDAVDCDVCMGFTSVPAALEGAIALTSAFSRSTTFGGMYVGVGLDLADATDHPAGAARAAAVARSAQANEILLAEALAVAAEQDPPDGLVVRRVDDDSTLDIGAVYRLASARVEVPNNLVPALTSLVGRDAEIAAVRRLLDQARLVTVTGPPGAGKTRLASEVAERLLGRYEDGAWFVPLAPIGDPSLMLPTFAQALGLQPTDRSVLDAISAHLQTRHVLAVLDNFEHITEAAPELNTLLAQAPGLQMLVTSRAPLHLSGEHEYAIPPLSIPEPDETVGAIARSDAVDLFGRRAAASQPTFRVSHENARQVGEICRRLDGLPLAIELAAARVKLMSLPAILARLDHRLALLTGGPRDLPARHQSLRAAVAWSYDLLDPSAQRLFRALSVFRGGWTINGAVAVSGDEASDDDDVLQTLAMLLDASLVGRQTADSAEPRFTMLETLRQFGAERLDEAGVADAARARHATYLIEMAERYEPELTGTDQAAALDRIAIEHDNIRAALGYLVRAKPEDALRLAAGIWRFWQMRGHLQEGARWLAGALEAAAADATDGVRAKAHAAAGGLEYWRGDMIGAQQHYEAALALRRAIGDELGTADALYDLAFVFAPHLNPPPEDPRRTALAIRKAEEAELLYSRAGNEPGIAKSGWLLGMVMMYRDIDRARTMLGDVVERFRRLDDPFGLGWALRMYGLALLGTANSAAAADTFEEALRLFAAAEDGTGIGLLLDDFAQVAKAQGDILRAARLEGAAESIRQLTEAELAIVNDAPWRVDASPADGAFDPAALEQARADGRAMSQAEAAAYALRTDSPSVPDRALRVTTLGRFRVERSGQPVSHWGGPKAGSRQAQALFAFLLDRGDRGVTKDECIEVIWPDAELAQGDLNFHRTLAGLRGTLEPDGRSTSSGSVIFTNGRYRLSPSVVGWLDVGEFEQRLLNASQATDEGAAIRGLEAARSLYGGDYLDDCPVYGDSGYVEDRRGLLRGRLVDALIDLGRRYETRGDSTLAAARFREALSVSEGDCPSATGGLDRLGVPLG